MMLLVSAAWAGLVATLIARAVAQFRGYQSLRPARMGDDTDSGWEGEAPAEPSAPSARHLGESPHVLVVVPARNEAQNIGRCVAGLLAQDYPRERLNVVVVDDHSTDATAEIVSGFAYHDNRCRLLSGRTLPPGWTGKSFACWQGAQESVARSPLSVIDHNPAPQKTTDSAPRTTDVFLCFVDADTVAKPGLISAAVAHCVAERVDLLSVEPFQQLGTFWERLILPAGMLLLAFSQDMRRVNDPADPAAAANGQFLLFRLAAYQAIGGHRAVRAAICEDTALARLIKQAGMRMQLVGGEEFISTRMYTGLRPLWEGISKNLTETLGGPQATLALAAAALVLGWCVPLVPLAAALDAVHAPEVTSSVACVLASAGSLALVGMHIGTLLRSRAGWWHALLLPVACTLGAALAVDAVWKRWQGSVAWKGRSYDTLPSQAAEFDHGQLATHHGPAQ